MHVELPIFAIVAAALVLVPLPWHWRARNIPTLSIIAWLFVSNIIYAVDSIIWADTVRLAVPVWCDITTKIQVGASFAIPACCMCLCIHLERIASGRQSGVTATQKRGRTIFDVLMCWIFPMVYMATHYVVQGHRFDIFEHFGCRPTVYVSLPSIFLITLPPFIVAAVTFVFGGLALSHFFRRRLTFARFLQNSNSALTPSRYLRLVGMAFTQMIWVTATLCLTTWMNVSPGLRPWVSWDFVHEGFSTPSQYPMAFFSKPAIFLAFLNWWFVPLSSFIFFAFFGFGEEAVKSYKARIQWIAKIFSKPSEAHSKPKQAVFATSPSLKVLKISYPKSSAQTDDTWTIDGCVSPSSTSITDTTFVDHEYMESQEKKSRSLDHV